MAYENLQKLSRKELQLIYTSRYQGYKSALKDLQAQIEKVFKNISIRPSIKSRVKSFKSYYRKMITKAAAPESKTIKTIDDLLLEALYAHNSHKITEAIEIYSYILSLKPGEQLQPIIYIHRGMAYFSESRYSLAMADFSEALRLNPENDKALYCRGVMYSIIQDYPKALADLNRCINLNPSWTDPILSRAQVYFHLGDKPKALADCEEALSLEPGHEQFLSFRNFIKLKMEL